jgi:hypothetical protein
MEITELNLTQFQNRTELELIPGIGRNWSRFPEFRNPTESDGIPSNFALTQFTEFRTGIASTYCGLTFEHNTMHVGEGEDQFRYGISGIDSKRN